LADASGSWRAISMKIPPLPSPHPITKPQALQNFETTANALP